MSDENEVLFQVTRAHLNTGLRGFPVGTCRSSAVSPTEGVSYVGYPIAELAYDDPESIVYLLYYKKLPNEAELAAFKDDLRGRSKLDPRVIELIKGLPKDGHPMEWLIAGLTFAGMLNKTGNYLEDSLNLTAVSSELVAAVFRVHQGWGEPIPSRPELGLVENFVHMLGVPGGDTARLEQLLRAFYVLHMDHGGGNLSTFVGKSVASGLADTYASMAASMAALYGPRHGKANQDCLDFVMQVNNPDPDYVETWVRRRLADGGLVFGFGHAVLRAEDPRAAVQYELGERLCPDDRLFRTAVTMRTVVPKILKENPKIQNPYPNVDAVSGTLLNACGLTNSNFYTVLFGWSRIAGICAQIIDERLHMRDGKGVAIYRCKYIAENQPKRSKNA